MKPLTTYITEIVADWATLKMDRRNLRVHNALLQQLKELAMYSDIEYKRSTNPLYRQISVLADESFKNLDQGLYYAVDVRITELRDL